jgi:glucose-6-phosphate 1-epimerase
MFMNIEELNLRYGSPERIVFRLGHGGFPEVVLANKYGSAEVSLYGASILSYRPTGHLPVLFRPSKRDYVLGDKFHGGSTLCWPQFSSGAIEGVCQHGFAQFLVFDVRSTKYSDESTEITIGVTSNEETLGVWPHKFDLELTVVLSMKLNLSLKTKNIDDKPFEFTTAFHPYFLVRDSSAVVIKGLDGCEYIDARIDLVTKHVQNGDFVAKDGADNVFTLKAAPKHEFALIDQSLRRAIAIASSGTGVCTVWNPHTAYKMVDHDDDDYKSFICVEPCSSWRRPLIHLNPGEDSIFVAAFQSIAE